MIAFDCQRVFQSHLLTCNGDSFTLTLTGNLSINFRFVSTLRLLSLRCLPQHAAETVVNALVTSRLDNCNALLLGLPKNLLQKLQYVQNSAARLIMGTNKRDHIRPVLKKLHWLPIDNRVVFKILLLTFKARAKLSPQYIQDLINDYTPQRNLRSGSKCLLETPNYNLESYGKRAFSVAAPRLWNSLPMELKTSTSIDIFKKKLKT